MLFTTSFSEDEYAALLVKQKEMGAGSPGDVIRAAVAAFKPAANAAAAPPASTSAAPATATPPSPAPKPTA